MSSFVSEGANFQILHQVPEGHVGCYWRGGALLKEITDPGMLTLELLFYLVFI